MRSGEQRCSKPLTTRCGYVAQSGVQMVDLKFCDLWGRWHHLTIPASQFKQSLMTQGIGFDGSSVGLKSVKSGDMVLIPDLATGVMDPFWDAPTLSFICNTHEAGTLAVFPNDPRNIARRAEQFLAETGIADESHWGPEFEFYVFDEVAWENQVNRAGYRLELQEADWNSPQGGHGHYIPLHGGYHAIPPKDQLYNLRAEMSIHLEALGVEVKYHHHEVGGPGQCEIETPLVGLLAAGDMTMWVKYVSKMTAHSHGKTVTFMPKPLFGEAGSGMHFHQMLRKAGQNVFYDASWLRLHEPTCPVVHRRAAGARTGAAGADQPQHQFLSSPGARLRSAGQRLLLAGQPQRCGAHSQVRRPAGDRAHGVSPARRDL